MAPELHCPMCDLSGQWSFHCDNEHCTWLRCDCRASLYSMPDQTMLLREARNDQP